MLKPSPSLKTSNRTRPSCLPDDPKVEVLTYVSRGFEPYRGFPQAMQDHCFAAGPEAQSACIDCGI